MSLYLSIIEPIFPFFNYYPNEALQTYFKPINSIDINYEFYTKR